MRRRIAKQWYAPDCYAKMANIWPPNRLQCAVIISTMKRLAISKHKSGHQSHRTRRPCFRTWSRVISSMCCLWLLSVAGSIGCSRGSWPPKFHFHWRYVSNRCCSEVLSWHRWTPLGYRQLPGISWMCSACAVFIHWYWAKIMVSCVNWHCVQWVMSEVYIIM